MEIKGPIVTQCTVKKVHAFYSCGPFIVSGVIGAETAEGKKKSRAC